MSRSSPGQILNSFGEFKISQRIKDKIANGRDSLSEGKYHFFPQTIPEKSRSVFRWANLVVQIHLNENIILGELPPQSMATTIDDGLSSGREGLSEGEIKPQKLKQLNKMKNHLGLAFEKNTFYDGLLLRKNNYSYTLFCSLNPILERSIAERV